MLLRAMVSMLRRIYRSIMWSIRHEASSTINGYIGDKKLGIDTSYYNEIVDQNVNGDSVRYEPAKYADISRIMEYLRLDSNDVLIDYGSGKGRVICSFATQSCVFHEHSATDSTVILPPSPRTFCH